LVHAIHFGQKKQKKKEKRRRRNKKKEKEKESRVCSKTIKTESFEVPMIMHRK